MEPAAPDPNVGAARGAIPGAAPTMEPAAPDPNVGAARGAIPGLIGLVMYVGTVGGAVEYVAVAKVAGAPAYVTVGGGAPIIEPTPVGAYVIVEGGAPMIEPTPAIGYGATGANCAWKGACWKAG